MEAFQDVHPADAAGVDEQLAHWLQIRHAHAQDPDAAAHSLTSTTRRYFSKTSDVDRLQQAADELKKCILPGIHAIIARSRLEKRSLRRSDFRTMSMLHPMKEQ